jgi:F420-non-reducing hydrogenase small subunit
VAFGSCASEGCIPGLANATSRRKIFDTAYHDTPSTENPERIEPQTATAVPEGTLHLPVFYETVRTLEQTVGVDYSLPGCPPEAERIWDAILAIVEKRLPPGGAGKGGGHLSCSAPEGSFRQKVAAAFSSPTVIGAETTVCDECQRTRKEKKVKKFYRTWQVIPDDETCLLEQGLLCCGIATRAGCGALCPQVNSPCIGCYGPNQGVHDFGARMMGALASMIDSNDPEEIDRIIREGIPDPVGSFYRFGLAGSHLRRAKKAAENGHD